jgi:hypothetical protein
MSSQHDTAQTAADVPEVDQSGHKAAYGLFTRLRMGRTMADRGRLAVEREQLELTMRRDAYEAQRPATGPQNAADAADAATAGDPVRWNFWRVLALVVLVPATLAFGAFMAFVVIGLQVGFWTGFLPPALQQITLKYLFGVVLDMPQTIPVVIEGGAWIMTFLAVVMLLFGRAPDRYVQYMWLLSGFAAVINTGHNATIGQPPGEHDWWTGLFTGALSLLGPFIVHSLMVAIREIVKGTSPSRAFLAGLVGTTSPMQLVLNAVAGVALFLLDFIVHPVISVRAIGIWRGVAKFSYRDAWNYAARPYYVALYNTYSHRIEKKRNAPVTAGDQKAGNGGNDERDARSVERDEPAQPPRPETTVTPADEPRNGGVLTAERDGDTGRSAERDATADPNVLAIHQDLDGFADVTDDDLRTVFGLDQPFHPDPILDTDRDARDEPDAQQRANPESSDDTDDGTDGRDDEPAPATTAEMRVMELVAFHWWTLKHAGTDPARLNKAKVARELGVSRSTVSKVFKACAQGTVEDPTRNAKA